MTENLLNLFLFTVVVLFLSSLLLPLVTYLTSGWDLRRREILTCFTDIALAWYFRTFFQTDYKDAEKPEGTKELDTEKLDTEKLDTEKLDIKNLDIEKLRCQFECYYYKNFGRKNLIFASLPLLTIATCFLAFFALSVIKPYLVNSLLKEGQPDSSAFLLTSLAAFAGGYMWTLQFLISRTQDRQLGPSNLCWGSFRLVMAVPVALSFTALFKGAFQEHALYALAFMLGAFPTQTLMTFMRRTAASKLNLQESLDDPTTNLTQLQGVGRNQAETFVQEGIETVLQLAYSDPVDLTIRTGFSFSYVVDCCSQALARLYFEDATMKKLGQFGPRGAQEIITLVDDLNGENGQSKEEQELAEKTMIVLAKKLEMDKDTLRRVFDEIAYDPYAQFLYNVWQPNWN